MYISNAVGLTHERAGHFNDSVSLQHRARVRGVDVLEDDGRGAIDHGAACIAGGVEDADGAGGTLWSEIDADADVGAGDLLKGDDEGVAEGDAGGDIGESANFVSTVPCFAKGTDSSVAQLT